MYNRNIQPDETTSLDYGAVQEISRIVFLLIPFIYFLRTATINSPFLSSESCKLLVTIHEEIKALLFVQNVFVKFDVPGREHSLEVICSASDWQSIIFLLFIRFPVWVPLTVIEDTKLNGEFDCSCKFEFKKRSKLKQLPCSRAFKN